MSDFATTFWGVIGWAVSQTTLDGWVAFSFIPLVVVFGISLWRADNSSDSAFKFVHFVTSDTGRGSVYALGYTMVVAVSAWGVWALIVMNRLTEWYMTLIIGGFVVGALGSTASRVIGRIRGAADPEPTAGDAPDGPAPTRPADPDGGR